MSLTKAQVNERFYDAVAGEVIFRTEAQSYLHPYAVARLVAAQSRARGKPRIKILELAANDCTFATSLLKLLTAFTAKGEAELEQIDYFAVDLARTSLETALRDNEDTGFHGVKPGSVGSPLVGTLTRLGIPAVNLHLVHSDANGFVSGGAGTYDFVVVNELLDDLPCRVYFADEAGETKELTAHAEQAGEKWTLTVDAEPADVELAPSRLTVTSTESVAVVRGAAAALDHGGVLIVHDYGFAEPDAPLAQYEALPQSKPDFVELEFPLGSENAFPRSFFRIFGHMHEHVVQVTTDVNFAELVEALDGGTTIVLPHGNALLFARSPEADQIQKGDGVFLSEFGTLELRDDVAALLEQLDRDQAAIRERFQAEHNPESTSVFADLVFVKA